MATLNLDRTARLLNDFAWEDLFNEIGWSDPTRAGLRALTLDVAGRAYTLTPIAELGGAVAFEVSGPGGEVPDQEGRKALHRATEPRYREHVLVFADGARQQAIWSYPKYDGKKLQAVRTHHYVRDQPADSFLAKLAGITFDLDDLDEDGQASHLDVTHGLRRALDVEGVTKKFYRAFRDQHLALIEAVRGVDDEGDRRWYASVLLTRLMFVYFLQKKGFLDGGNRFYLEDKLAESRARSNGDGFYRGYFRELISALFFGGFATPEDRRTDDVRDRIGKIPYLNGGLFLQHPVEQDNPDLDVPDETFVALLEVFGAYDWYLDPEERPDGTQSRDYLNPDVLGYIFEKYINQKAFGAYYTRPEITEYLCDQTVDGLILDRINGPKEASGPGARPRRSASLADLLMTRLDDALCKRLLFEVLPRLSLLDPACGSGAFLVAALKKLLTVYQAVVGRAKLSSDAELRGWIEQAEADHPSLAYYLKRKVITENLFGVDLMEEATEIAKLRLFLALVASARTVDELEPLPNVDFNVMAGNSLVGLLHVQGDDFRRYAQADLFSKSYPELLVETDELTDRYRFATGQDRTLDLQILRDTNRTLREGTRETLDEILLAEMTALGVRYEQAETRGGGEGYRKRPLELADVQRLEPFHWGYEFSRVLVERGGFDGIIANPPWDKLKPEAKEFFMTYADVVEKNNMRIEDFEAHKAELLKAPEVREAWLEYLSTFPYQKALFRSSPDYSHQTSTVNGRKVGTDLNLYQLFLERCWRLLRPAGRCGIIVPTDVYGGLGAKGVRTMLFDESRVTSLFGFSNEKYLFDGIHHDFKFVVLAFERGGTTEEFEAAFRFNPREAVGKEDVAAFLEDSSRHVRIETALVRALSPEAHAVLEYRSETDKTIANNMTRFPRLIDDVDATWSVSFHREFHKTGDSGLFHKSAADGRIPLTEGKMIHQFDADFSQPKYWIDERQGRNALTKHKNIDFDQIYDYQSYRLGFRDVSNSSNERTSISAILPRGRFCDHTVSLLWTRGHDGRSLIGDAEQLYLVAVFNSVVFDWLIRLKVAKHLSFFLVESQPVPRLTAADAAFGPVVHAAARLTCVTPEFDDLAASVGLGDHTAGATDAGERAALRAELDARIAHLYGLTAADLAHVLATFPLVEDTYKAAVLDTYDALARSAEVPPDDAAAAQAVAAGEGPRVEFKQTLRRALDPAVPDAAIEGAVLKTVAAFLNTDGGVLLVGVRDDGASVGLAHDGFRSEDAALLHLRNLVNDRLGPLAWRHLDAAAVWLGGERVLKVVAGRSLAPVYARERGGAEVFYVRTGPATTALSASQTVAYVGEHFGAGR